MDFETRSRVKPELNIAPLIDVVFILLIFFMLTSSMIKINQIEIDLPESTTAKQVNEKMMNVSLLANGSFFLDGQAISDTKLQKKLNKVFTKEPNKAILLSVESSATAEQMVAGMDLIRKSGGSNISLATDHAN